MRAVYFTACILNCFVVATGILVEDTGMMSLGLVSFVLCYIGYVRKDK